MTGTLTLGTVKTGADQFDGVEIINLWTLMDNFTVNISTNIDDQLLTLMPFF